MGNYVPSTEQEKTEMLREIGFTSYDDLFRSIPAELRLKRKLNLPDGCSEMEIRRKMNKIASKNTVFDTVLRGAGAYRHYIPSVVKSIASKEEFVTAYTPYQAEISQGILQAIFEFQTMMCDLTGLNASNASVYDGATAAAEAVAMCKERGKTKVLLSASANPQVIETIKTYCNAAGTPFDVISLSEGLTDAQKLKDNLCTDTACFYVEQPNFFGLYEDIDALSEIIHTKGAKLIVGCNPIALGIIKTPGECGADIAVGEGQPLGLPLSFGGPYLGFMTCTEKLMRKLPGRIVGETTDGSGNRAFVLTLQAREQHIRREKASSNVCSNEALCALTAAAYLSTMGPEGLKSAAIQCTSKAHYFAQKLCEIKGFSMKFHGEYFHEFVSNCPKSPQAILNALEERGILGGLPLKGELEGSILWCVTELVTKEEIDRTVMIIKEVCEK